MSDEFEPGKGRAVPSADDAVDVPAAAAADDALSGPDLGSASEGPGGSAGLVREAPLPDEIEPDETEPDVIESVDRESELVGAGSAGSARAAARRSGVRAGSTPAKGVATRQRDLGQVTRVGLYARLRRFLREVVAELRKVIWPARNQMVTYTIVVIVFVVFMVALTAGLDVLFAKLVLAVFG